MRLSLLALGLLLASCSYTYIPPVPEYQSPQPRLRLENSEGLRYQNDRLALYLLLEDVPAEGWLALQWFSPSGDEVASASIWLSSADIGQERILYLPADVEIEAGFWRALLSFEGQVLRQYSLEL